MKDIKIITTESGYATEGLKNHIDKELQINISLDKETAEYVLGKVSERIIKGEVIEDKSFDETLLNCKIYFVHKNSDIVIVFPDVKRRYPWDEACQDVFVSQI